MQHIFKEKCQKLDNYENVIREKLGKEDEMELKMMGWHLNEELFEKKLQ